MLPRTVQCLRFLLVQLHCTILEVSSLPSFPELRRNCLECQLEIIKPPPFLLEAHNAQRPETSFPPKTLHRFPPSVFPQLGLIASKKCVGFSSLVPSLPCLVFPQKTTQRWLPGSHLVDVIGDLNYIILPPSGHYTVFLDSQYCAPKFLIQSWATLCTVLVKVLPPCHLELHSAQLLGPLPSLSSVSSLDHGKQCIILD